MAARREGVSLPPVVRHAKRVAGSDDGIVLVETPEWFSPASWATMSA